MNIKKSKISTMVSLALAVSFSGIAIANSKEGVKEKDVEIEIIEVSGIQASLNRATEMKRGAKGITEAISAEDIGSLPDISIAESLERITGLAADRDRGNSSQISIRGLGPQLGMAFVNNREITSASPSRAVKFEQFPSELLTSAEVYKSPTADLIEGGLSGTINMNTIKPLSKGKQIATVNFKSAYSEMDGLVNGSDGLGYRMSGAFIDQFWNKKLGIAVGVAKRDMPSSTQRYVNWGYFDNKDWNDDGVNDYVTAGISGRTTIGNDTRDGIFLAAQWRPSDAIDINYDFLHTDQETTDDRSFFVFGGIKAANVANATNVVVDEHNTVLAANNVQVKGNEAQIHDQFVQNEDSTKVHGLNLAWASGDWEVSGDLSHSKTQRQQSIALAKLRARSNPTINFDNTDSMHSLSTDFDLNDPGNFWPWQAEIQNVDIEDDLTAFKFDVSKFVGTFITEYSFGARISTREKSYIRDLDKPTVWGGQGKAYDLTADPSLHDEFAYSEVYDFIDGSLPQSWLNFDLDGYLAAYWATPDALNTLDESDRLASWKVKEDTTAVYFNADFEGELGDILYFGSAGLRYVETEVTSFGTRSSFSVIENPTDEQDPIVFDPDSLSVFDVDNNYSELLPSLNINFELSDSLLLRTAYAKTMVRAPLDKMAASQTLYYNRDEQTIKGRGGNPKLKPITANQYDLSLEWYFDENSLLAAAAFYKEVDTFVVNSFVTDSISGIPTELDSPVNDAGGEISGLELTYKQRFSFLPGIAKNLGMYANYTLIDNNAETLILNNGEVNEDLDIGLDGVSDELANIAIYYDDKTFSSRLAYRYRSEFTRNIAGIRQNQEAAFVDVNFGYNYSKNLKFTLSIANLTDETLEIIHVPSNADTIVDERVNFIESSGRRVFLGARYKF